MNPDKDGRETLPGQPDDPSAQSEPGSVEASGGASGDAPEEDAEDRAPGEMTLTQHLEELRTRLIRCAIALAVGFGICYGFSEQLFDILMSPMEQVLRGSNFIYTYPPEAFFTYLKVALVAGFFVVSPYIFYQVWLFVTPGLYESERKWLIPIAFFTAIFFVIGSLFGYFVVFPFGFEFFASYSSERIVFTPKLSEYLGFSLKLLFAFGLVFELPLVIFFLARLGLVTSQGLRKKRKYAVLLIFITAAILTPPDVFTQSLMAGPMILLYEIGILVARFFGKEKAKPEPTEDEEAEESAK